MVRLSISSVEFAAISELIFILLLMNDCAAQVNFIAPPQNITVTRGSDVTISCGYQWHTALRTTWLINGTVFTLEQLRDSSMYQLNSVNTPTASSLAVFSINSTTTFRCLISSTPSTTSTVGTVTVIEPTITMPPENATVCRGTDITISCGHVITMPRPVVWIINGTSFTQLQISVSPLYQPNRQATPNETSLIVFSISSTTTFQCVIPLTPNTTSTLGTVIVIGPIINIESVEIIMKRNRFEIIVSWQVDTDCSETVVMYNITVMDQYSPASVTVPANVLSADISELPDNGTSIVANREYTITVSAISDHEYSYPSDPVVFNTFVLQNCAATSPSIGTIRVSCGSSHQILVTLTCTDNCSNPMVTSYGSSPLTMTGLDGGVTYGVIINVFDGNQVVLRCETVVKLITVMTNNSGSGTLSDSKSGDSSSSTEVVVAVVCIVTSVTVTAVITFIITYVFVKRKIESKNDPKYQSTEEKVLYEQVSSPNSTITKKVLELQPNPAYGVSHEVNMDSNPAYESCQ